jgi:hypothetical protein
MIRLPTASALFRASKCPACFTLPWVQSTSPDAQRGIAGHRFLDLLGRGNTPAASLLDVPEEHRAMCEAIELEGLPIGGRGFHQEESFAFDLESAQCRTLGQGLDRNYSLARASEIVGTADVVGYGSSEAVRVFDYKFEDYESHTPKVATNPQIRFAALCAARCAKTEGAIGILIHIRPDGSHWEESALFDGLALDEVELELQTIARRVRAAGERVAAGEVPDVARGEWCRYCPAVCACPAVVGLVRAAAGAPSQTAADLRAALHDRETAAAAYRHLREVDSALKETWAALHVLAVEHPIDLGNGRVFGPVHSQRKAFNALKARAVLAEEYGTDIADNACTFDTSAAAIERALRPVFKARAAAADEAKARGEAAKRVTLKATLEEAMGALAKAGAIETKDSVKLSEHAAERRRE